MIAFGNHYTMPGDDLQSGGTGQNKSALPHLVRERKMAFCFYR